MKKSLLLAVAMVVASFGAADAKIIVNATNMEQPANDTLLFALPVDTAHHQEIWTTYTHPETGQAYRPTMYQPEYLVTAQDFTRGDTNKGTATLPNNAKVIGLALDGYIQACEDEAHCYQAVTAWCRNIPLDKKVLDYLDLFDGYSTHLPQGQIYTDTTFYKGYLTTYPGVYCPIDVNSSRDNLCTIVDLPFGTPDDSRMPFWYTGENIYLTLWLKNYYNPAIDGGTHIEYHYMAYDEAEVEYASLMRSGNICFNNLTQDLVHFVPGWENMDLMYELPKYRLPAFRTPYYTNDVRIIRKGYNTVFDIVDQDGNVMVPAEDGNYYCLDHTKEYSVLVNDEVKGTFSFNDIYQDIELEIENTTAVEELNADKAISSVVYYNLAGQQSTQPVDGVNIVVTTYTDGSTTTAKVIK